MDSRSVFYFCLLIFENGRSMSNGLGWRRVRAERSRKSKKTNLRACGDCNKYLKGKIKSSYFVCAACLQHPKAHNCLSQLITFTRCIFLYAIVGYLAAVFVTGHKVICYLHITNENVRSQNELNKLFVELFVSLFEFAV